VEKITKVNSGKAAADQALKDRNQKTVAMEKAVRTLLSELHQVLESTDSRWVSFGFNRPGIQKRPEAPVEVSAKVVNETAIEVKWPKVPRAGHYRVWMKVVGRDEDLMALGSPNDPDFMIESVTPGDTVELAVSAVNERGESGKSVVLLLQLPVLS